MLIIKIKVDFQKKMGKMDHFWESTGFTPAELLLRSDMEQTIKYFGSVANRGLKHVRIHYLLRLVKLVKKNPFEWDWSQLDQGLDLLVENNLKPFFELMGNPAPDYFNNFSDEEQLIQWKNFIREMVLHYINRYGLKEVRSWYFETTNEPDVGWDWGWGGNVKNFCNYYDACSEGLKEADPQLIFGGPGTCQTLSPIFKGLIQHCDQGTNFFTGEKGVRLDFISVHEKGVKAHKEDLNPDSRGIKEREIKILKYIKNNHSRFKKTPFMNNECDPQVGWADIHTWRAKPYYAAIAAKIINQHLVDLKQVGVNYRLLSNDNGFIGTWGNRTLLCRFGNDDKVKKGKFSLIKKPIFNLMTMLSLLGDTSCSVEKQEESDEIGVLATITGKDQVAALIYNSKDQIMNCGKSLVKLNLKGIPFSKGMVVHYRIDKENSNPYSYWEDSGAQTFQQPTN
ncbi:MAG: GH39 family glycosyl hydrolase [Bacillota bacterium]